MCYIVITSAYNEAKNISKTAESVIKQTVLPILWLIIDDGSTDETYKIALRFENDYPWIKVLKKPKEKFEFGEHAVRCFYYGYDKVKNDIEYKYIVKLDADIVLDRSDYFEYQINKFESNSRLGITSGITYYYSTNKEKKLVKHPHWRTTGALKMYRKECFQKIGGLVPIYGWDGLDDYKARYCGFITKTFFDLEVNHLEKKRDLSRNHKLQTAFNRGVSYYIRGYSPVFVFLKFFQFVIKGHPSLGIQYVKGYIMSYFRKTSKVVTKDEQKFIRSFFYKRLFNRVN